MFHSYVTNYFFSFVSFFEEIGDEFPQTVGISGIKDWALNHGEFGRQQSKIGLLSNSEIDMGYSPRSFLAAVMSFVGILLST